MNRFLALCTKLSLLLAVFFAAGCSNDADEKVGSTSSKIDSRFDPNYPAPHQVDDWSCSVHTTTWMLQATGHDVSWSTIAARMQNTGRVTQAQGLSDSNGPGIVATLREYADGKPDIGNKGTASFDEIAQRAGHMAVGIGGRGWNHWTAVRGYDANRDVLLLANSAPAWKGVGQELDRGEFARLGSFAMVWMDFGQIPDFQPTERPTGGPFQALEIKYPLGAGGFVTQCNESADGERVWQTTAGGPTKDARWAEAKYPQMIKQSCGEPGPLGIHPLVFRSWSPGEVPAWVAQCSGWGDGSQHVYRVDGEVDGHPAARYLYNEPNADCE